MQVSRDNLPKSMRYAMSSVPAVQADCQLARFDSTNGVSFDPAGANEIRIRIKANGFMQTDKHYLYFEVTNNSANTGYVDGDCNSFFDRMTIEANGTQVEQIDRYALWSGIVRNYQKSADELHKINVEGGGGQFAVVNQDTGDAAKNGHLMTTALSNMGETITNGQSRVFCISLNSGLLNNTFSKCLPDGLIELELILRLKPSAGALLSVNGSAATYTISNPRFYCPVFKILNGDVMSSYNQLAGSGISWIGDTVKTYVNSVTDVGGTKSLQINDRSMSLKALITALRDANADADVKAYSNTSFTINQGGNNNTYVENYVYKIAGNNYPQSQIDIQPSNNGKSLGRCHQETIKALAKPGQTYASAHVDREQFGASILSFNNAGAATNATINAKGLLCVDLKKFDDKELRMVGIQTSANASPSVLELQTNATYTVGALDATTYALVEAVWTMDNTGALRVAM